MTPKVFFGELKRRNVLKVSAAYAVTSWLLLEAASLWRSIVGGTPGVIKALAVVLALGFALTVYISWAFEATPEGMKRTEKVAPDTVLPTWSPRKFALFIITVALFAAGLHLFDRFRGEPPSPPSTPAPGAEKP